MTALIIIALASLLVLLGLYCWGRSLPVAWAWDPNSHDKMTSYALDLLEQEKNQPLLGWLLSLSRGSGDARFFRHAIESQIRRGSVEEDMNSFLLDRSLFTGYSLGPLQIFKGGTDTLEGANGGYHFLNPQKTGAVQGLNDPPFFVFLIGRVASGCSSPMPSAIDRAFSSRAVEEDTGWSGYLTSTKPWHLDNEIRNYSLGDATYYVQQSYAHLGFYAIGRVCHLLQDMTVPAHVRNDAHPGGMYQDIGYDPSDPLEMYADGKDKPVGGFPETPHKWAFDPFRVYASKDEVIFKDAKPIWTAYYSRYPAPRQRLFMNLANITYHRQYSYNTIPGNANSHEPESPETYPLARSGKIDWEKCQPSTDALYELLGLFLQDAQVIFPEPAAPTSPFSAPPVPAATSPAKNPAQIVAALGAQIKTVTFRENWDCKIIIGICPKYNFPAQSLREMLNQVKQLYALVKAKLKSFENPSGPYASPQMSLTFLETVAGFAKRYERLNLDLLKKIADGPLVAPPGGADYDNTTTEIMRKWLEAHTNPQDLFDAFNVSTPSVNAWFHVRDKTLNGPCCLTEKIIEKQWIESQAHGVAFTAMLLASWFEQQFIGGGFPGLEVWLNQDPGDPLARPQVKPTADPAKGSQYFAAKKTACLGIINRIPVPLEMVMEIELVEDEEFTDPDLLETGVELELVWDLFRARNLESAGFWKEFPKTSDHFLSNDLKAYLAQGSASKGSWQPQDLDVVTLGGTEGGAKKLNVPLGELEPFNLLTLCKYPLARGRWSPKDTEMGGITREDEQNPELFQPLGVSQTGQMQNQLISAAILRMIPRVKGEAKPSQTSTSSEAGPDDQEQQP